MISIVTPSYNVERYIAEAIESVLAQSISDWELIVVDDGSTDRTREIVQSYCNTDCRIRLVEAKHGGVSAARNLGLMHARFEWIALLDSDDAFLPEKLKVQLAEATEGSDVVLWGTYAYNMGEDGVVFDVARDGPTSRKHFEYLWNSGGIVMLKNSSALFKKSLAVKLGGFDSTYDSAEDTELWNRMATFGPVVVIPKPLIKYRYHSSSLSVSKMEFQHTCVQFIRNRNRRRVQRKDLQFDEFLRLYAKRNPLLKWYDNRSMKSNCFWRNSGIMFTNKRKQEGLRWLALAFLNHPPMIAWRLARKIWKRFERDPNLVS